MQAYPNVDFNDVERRIQTLTSILQKLDRRYPPTPSDRSQVPTFLRQFATFLNCGDNEDADVKNVVAVTSGSTVEGLWTLVVTQNPFDSSSPSALGVKEITKSSGTFDHVVNKDKNSTLSNHIADVWAAIASYDPSVEDQIYSFGLFIVARCFRKLSKRVFQDNGCWGVSVSQKIHDWTPRDDELGGVRWIEQPTWIELALLPIQEMNEREIQKHGKLVTEWELSTTTLHSWAWLLATILKQVELAIHAAKRAREKNRADEETQEIINVHKWCLCLYGYVHWNEDIVRTLLTKTSLAHAFRLGVGSNMGDVEADEFAEMRKEPGESEGQQVLRHLQAIVAWHAAANGLLNGKSQLIAQTLVVGLVQVAPIKPDLMTNEEVIHEFFRRHPASSPEERASIENTIKANHTETTFTGSTTHAEATLMGLLTYFSPGAPSFNQDVQLEEHTFRLLKTLVEPATLEKAIAVGKKCCWCCDRLGSLLGDIKLPGSHGVLYSWTPPRLGISVTILQALENALWVEMKAAVGDTISLIHSRQSSGSSTVAGERGKKTAGPADLKSWIWT